MASFAGIFGSLATSSYRIGNILTFVGAKGSHWELRRMVNWFLYRSLGCLLFELITLIPIWQPNYCVVKGSSRSRRGLMGLKTRSIDSLISKQKCFRSLALRRVK